MRINVGPLPPPIGGISTYLYRLSKIKKDELFISDSKVTLLKLIIYFMRGNVLVFHSFMAKHILILLLFSRFCRGKYVICFYGEGLKIIFNNANIIKKELLHLIITKASNIEVVNDHIFSIVAMIEPRCTDKIIMKCDRLPPPLEDEEKILKTYDDGIHEFFATHSQVILLNAFRLAMYNGIDLYGVDISIDALHILKKKYKDIGLFFALPDSEYNKEYFNKLQDKIKEYGLEDSFYVMTGQRELWPLFKKASVFIRPTCTDGDALSIGEALYFKCPTIASDVCKRPDGVIMFKSRDTFQLVQKIEQVLKNGVI